MVASVSCVGAIWAFVCPCVHTHVAGVPPATQGCGKHSHRTVRAPLSCQPRTLPVLQVTSEGRSLVCEQGRGPRWQQELP